jgi:hypothetical protein
MLSRRPDIPSTCSLIVRVVRGPPGTRIKCPASSYFAFMDDGVCTNQAESFFSRLRRMVGGQHHKVSGQYLHQYAAHAAWMEDHRRLDNGALANRALGLALGHCVSRQWKGYWQR